MRSTTCKKGSGPRLANLAHSLIPDNPAPASSSSISGEDVRGRRHSSGPLESLPEEFDFDDKLADDLNPT